jgi:NAD(P)-dependent dehydrogenase (short-subunit alcohol dehydrogenase family)
VFPAQHQDTQPRLLSRKQAAGKDCTCYRWRFGNRRAVALTYTKLDILVNNAAVQYPQNSISDISREQLNNTFETNIYSYFFATKAALSHLEGRIGSTIINTASVVAFKGNPRLIDYSATKSAIASFTWSMEMSLVKQGNQG